MKKALTLLIGTAAITTSALATNGTQLIATTAKARAMGGVGVATYMGAGASNNNPALYAKESSKAVSGGLTFFSPSVTYLDAGGKDNSDYGNSIMPDIGYAHKIDDDMAIGIGFNSVAGSGVDYSTVGKTAAAGAKNELKIAQISIPFSYNFTNLGVKGLALGIAPVIQSSSLSTNYGDESSMDFGVNLGATYDLESVTFGIMYKTAISSDYGDAMKNLQGQNVSLANPSTFGLGLDYSMSDATTIAFDYKYLAYGSASGYSDFGWSNQHVFALGAEHNMDVLALRIGLNYGSNIVDSASVDQTIATYIGFPALTAAHFTIGGGYDLKEYGVIDASFVYGISFSDAYTYEVSGLPELVKATNNQASLTVDYTYAF